MARCDASERSEASHAIGRPSREARRQAKGGPGYARLNSGVMVHSRAPETILRIFMKGAMVKAHCTNSSSRTYANDEWVAVEVEVLGSERVRHLIDGQTVLQYETPSIGGGVANGSDPAIKKDGKVLERGCIGLQAESQPVELRNVRLLNLSGSMNRASPAYRPYFVHRDDTRCR